MIAGIFIGYDNYSKAYRIRNKDVSAFKAKPSCKISKKNGVTLKTDFLNTNRDIDKDVIEKNEKEEDNSIIKGKNKKFISPF